MKKGIVILSFFFCISLFLNVYLFNTVVDWQEAWLKQLITTSDIERLYRKSGADVSFDSIKKLVDNEFDAYQVVSAVESDNLWAGDDKDAILVYGTKLFFKDGQYIGSKADVPEGLVHWKLGSESL